MHSLRHYPAGKRQGQCGRSERNAQKVVAQNAKQGHCAEAYAKCDPHKIAHHIPTGPPKPNSDLTGWAIKEIWRDSFGNPYYDSFPEFFLPIGFAGGLEDPDTGLVRFGWRDYDPTVGRFTAPDPARDTRGDGDLYDYCVDDPVSCVDPAGLFWFLPALYSGAVALAEGYPLLAGAAGAAGALGLGLGGSYLAAAGADLAGNSYIAHSDIRNTRPQNKSTAAWDGVNKIAPDVAAAHAAAFSPLAAFALPEATAAANTILEALGPTAIGATMAATGAAQATNRLERAAKNVAHFAEGAFVPGVPRPDSVASHAGWVTNQLDEKFGWSQSVRNWARRLQDSPFRQKK